MNSPHAQHPVAQYIYPFFCQHLTAERGLSTNTVAAYRDAMKLLLGFAADRSGKPPEELTVEDLHEHTILEFLDYVETTRECSVKTRNARLTAIRTFFGFIARQQPLLLEQCRRVRTIPLKRAAQRSLDYLDDTEMTAMFDAVTPDERLAERDDALLLFMYNTGARAQEVADVMIEDLRLEQPEHVKLHGKGGKERVCPLWPETAQALRRYIEHRQPKQPIDTHLFLNANGVPITRFGIRHIVRKYAAKAAEKCPSIAKKPVTAHTIRHSTAMHLIQSGNDVNSVRLWLGHADLNTTHIYVELDLEMKRQILERCSPPTPARQKKTPPWLQPGILTWLENLTRSAQLNEAAPRQVRTCGARSAPLHLSPRLLSLPPDRSFLVLRSRRWSAARNTGGPSDDSASRTDDPRHAAGGTGREHPQQLRAGGADHDEVLHASSRPALRCGPA